ncbi:bifunctional 3-(3-hydroxy-phenyl)propionate/3-hydroxycinnamic acid hydroxylase [Myceligenerans sp. I2]|uniref:Bifunctional 3-(3-hydroxy-phenyl)propionate/3-hydroxycinnamic acid hydroxylase n=2 Tax=Myceligenerans indicum TaxID=2593663 RepID=A0ABS1LME5_9MICO|nr:bifunctional 3-(3-hydroxy-phenyl)propionate/3-hydroxycinnamic acid hydroxylase [Myceligenerans indicum]
MDATNPGDDVSEDVYDVAIIGYGPVGATAANLLGASGVRVAVLEREPSPYGRARAISTDEEVLRIWQGVGLAERLKADMLGDRPIDFVDAGGHSFLSLAPEPRGNGHPTQMFIYQPAVEQVLRAGVGRYPNVTVMLRHECVGHEELPGGVRLLVRGPDGVGTVRARYVIASDGGSSPTRTRLGIGFEGRTYEDRWLVVDTKVRRPWPDIDRLRFHCNPRRPAVDCPTPLGHHRWEFPVLPGDDEDELVRQAAVLRLLGEQGVTAEHVEVARAVVYSHHVRLAERWRAGRVFLAGDAAHVMPPWIGEGMASGVRDVANLSWKLAEVLRGTLPETVLDSYEAERKPHVRRVTAWAVRFGQLVIERRPFAAALRDPVLRAVMRVPLLGSWLRAGRWFPDPRYRRGFFSGGRRGMRLARADCVGWLLPQPWVADAENVHVRLDDALPEGWVVLRRTGTATGAWADAGVPVLDVLPGGSGTRPDAIVDVEGTLLRWMAAHRCDVVVLRPDRFVYGSARASGALVPPPFPGRVTTRAADIRERTTAWESSRSGRRGSDRVSRL